jgi:type IV fimbrial biogenesis protein FimT
MQAQRRRCVGATLLELLLALALAAGLLKLGVPAYGSWIARLEQRSAADALRTALQTARSEAIKRSGRVTVCQTVDGRTCAGRGGWHSGWLTFPDDDADAELDPGDRVIRAEPALARRVTIVGNRPVADYVSYTPYGHARLLNGALHMGTFTVCRSGLTALQVVLANTGRLRIVETRLPCP